MAPPDDPATAGKGKGGPSIEKPVDEFIRCIKNACSGMSGEALAACIKGCADVVVASPEADKVQVK